MARYDGKSWKNFSVECGLADKLVESIVVDPDGSLWFGSEAGAARFDGKDWQTYTQAEALAKNTQIVAWHPGWQGLALHWAAAGRLLR